MTDDELSQIEARANAATPGPWREIRRDDPSCAAEYVIAGADDISVACTSCNGEYCTGMTDADCAFIAAARTDVPALVAEVRRLRDIVERVRAADLAQIENDIKHEARAAEHGKPCTWQERLQERVHIGDRKETKP